MLPCSAICDIHSSFSPRDWLCASQRASHRRRHPKSGAGYKAWPATQFPIHRVEGSAWVAFPPYVRIQERRWLACANSDWQLPRGPTSPRDVPFGPRMVRAARHLRCRRASAPLNCFWLSLRSAQSHKRDLCDFRKQRDGWCCESTEVSTEMEAQSAMRWRGCAGASVRERLTAAIGARQICVFGETQLSKNRGNGGGPLTALALWSSRLALLASTCRCTRRKHHRQRELQPSNANEPTLPKVSWLGRNRRHPPILIRRGAVLNGP